MRGPPPDYDRRGGGWGPRGPPMGGPGGPRGGGYGGPGGGGGGPPFRGGGGGYGPPQGRMGPPPPAAQQQLLPPITVDREKTCPLLLRVWTKKGGHNRLDVYAKRGQEPEGELQIYTWPDASLRELADLIMDVTPDVSPRARLSFAFVYPNSRGVNVMKEVGQVWAEPKKRGPDDTKSLHQLSFQTGDFLDVAFL